MAAVRDFLATDLPTETTAVPTVPLRARIVSNIFDLETESCWGKNCNIQGFIQKTKWADERTDGRTHGRTIGFRIFDIKYSFSWKMFFYDPPQCELAATFGERIIQIG